MFKRATWLTPWTIMRISLPITFVLPLIGYWLTLYRKIYPHLPAALTAQAAGIIESADLSHPIFNLIARLTAQLPWETLTVRLNTLTAICGAVTVALFYMLVTRIIFMLGAEDSGGAMRALPPDTPGSPNDQDSMTCPDTAGVLSSNAVASIPPEVHFHNLRVAYSAMLGALGASIALAFCGPFWFASTRLLPYTFDLMLFFLILNTIISYDQKARTATLLLSVFLLAICSVESGIFLILAPVGVLILYRSMKLSEQFTMGRLLLCIIIGLVGAVIAALFLWNAAGHCATIPTPAPRPILNVFQMTLTKEIFSWIPRFGWSRIFVFFIMPLVLAFAIFSHSFRIRKPLVFFLQLVLAALLIPSLINLPLAPWGIARLISKTPVYTYTIIAATCGLLFASLHLMREIFQDQLDEDLDFYEYRDNPVVCRLGALLCWPLLLITLCVPFFSYKDVNASEGNFTDAVADNIFASIKDKQLILDIPFLKHETMIKALEHDVTLYFYSIETLKGGNLSQHNLEYINNNPAFDDYRCRLINAAEISPFSFMREWLSHDPTAYRKIILFSYPGIFRKLGYTAVPNGFCMELIPLESSIDSQQLFDNFIEFTKTMHPYLFPTEVDSIKLLTNHRNAYRRQLAFNGNELAALFIKRREYDLAAQLLKHCAELSPQNLCIWLNLFHLGKDLNVATANKANAQLRLTEWPDHNKLLNLTLNKLKSDHGTLADEEIFEYAKKRFWTRSNIFRNLAISQEEIFEYAKKRFWTRSNIFRNLAISQEQLDPITELRNKKRHLYSSIKNNILANDLNEADSQLNILLDIDDADHFALLNKAKVAILRENLPEAGLWMDLAKEAEVPSEKLLWHEAAVMNLNGKVDETLELLNDVIPDNTTNRDLWNLLAEILLKTNDFEQLRTRVYPALRNTSRLTENYMFYVVKGHLLQQGEDSDLIGARSAFIKALELNPELDDIENKLLDIDMRLFVPAFMESDTKSVLIDNPEHSLANALMGFVRLNGNQTNLAEDFFARSLKNQITTEALRGYAEVMLKRNKTAEAADYIERALAIKAQDIDLLHLKTRILIAQNEIAEATTTFQDVIKTRPDDLSVRLTMTRLLMHQGKLEDAAMIVSNMLDREDYLPRPIVQQLKKLAYDISKQFKSVTAP